MSSRNDSDLNMLLFKPNWAITGYRPYQTITGYVVTEMEERDSWAIVQWADIPFKAAFK